MPHDALGHELPSRIPLADGLRGPQKILPLVHRLGLTGLLLKDAGLVGQPRFGLRGDCVQSFRARQLAG